MDGPVAAPSSAEPRFLLPLAHSPFRYYGVVLVFGEDRFPLPPNRLAVRTVNDFTPIDSHSAHARAKIHGLYGPRTPFRSGNCGYPPRIPLVRQSKRADPREDTRYLAADMSRFPLIEVFPVFSPTERAERSAMLPTFHRNTPLPIDNAPRSVPRFLVTLVHERARRIDARVGGQVDIAR